MQKSGDTKINHLVFRADAVRRYLKCREEAVLPRFVSPHAFVYLWLLVSLFIAIGFVAWFVEIPVYVSGPAVITNKGNILQYGNDDVVLTAFLPPENLSRLQVGQSLFLQFTPGGDRLSRPIIAVEPEIISPEMAQEWFGVIAGGARDIIKPSAVVIARLEPIPTGLPSTTYIGSVYQVDVEVGSCRLFSFLPLIGGFFGGNTDEVI